MFGLLSKTKVYDAYIYLKDNDEESVIEYVAENIKGKSRNKVREVIIKEKTLLKK